MPTNEPDEDTAEVVRIREGYNPPEKTYEHEQPRPKNLHDHPARLRADLPVKDILRGVANADLDEVVVVGTRKDGSEFMSTSRASIPVAMYLLERGKHTFHRIMDEKMGDRETPETGPDAA